MKRPWTTFVFIIILTMLGIAIVKPNAELNFYSWHREYEFSQGLDLQGGVHLKYLLDLASVPEADQAEAIKGARNVMEKRINPMGVAEPVILTSKVGDKTALIIELPGQKDVQQAISTIGQTAQLSFKEQNEAGDDWQDTGLTGADLKPNGSRVGQNPTTLKPLIELNFTEDGGRKFGEITERNLQKPIAIFLDDQPLQIATVQDVITSGQAQISGDDMDIKQVQDTVRLLNAGALPVPLELVEQRQIGATLGQESIHRSLVAGIVGLVAVALFMVFYYGRLGVIAVISLLLYVLFSLALFRIIPITLTLAGITGFILSIGMAVDANILIFERLKEELAEGKSMQRAIKDGFDRAWTSIRDSNVSSILTALILYNFGASSLIRGFSLTLIVGILISLFTAITVSRTLLLLSLGTRFLPGKGEPTEEKREATSSLKRSEKLRLGRNGRW